MNWNDRVSFAHERAKTLQTLYREKLEIMDDKAESHTVSEARACHDEARHDAAAAECEKNIRSLELSNAKIIDNPRKNDASFFYLSYAIVHIFMASACILIAIIAHYELASLDYWDNTSKNEHASYLYVALINGYGIGVAWMMGYAVHRYLRRLNAARKILVEGSLPFFAYYAAHGNVGGYIDGATDFFSTIVLAPALILKGMFPAAGQIILPGNLSALIYMTAFIFSLFMFSVPGDRIYHIAKDIIMKVKKIHSPDLVRLKQEYRNHVDRRSSAAGKKAYHRSIRINNREGKFTEYNDKLNVIAEHLFKDLMLIVRKNRMFNGLTLADEAKTKILTGYPLP